MENIKLTTLTCKRCGYKWWPRKPYVMLCPKCHSAYWDKERIKKDGKVSEEICKEIVSKENTDESNKETL